jgi:hypothetical protein
LPELVRDPHRIVGVLKEDRSIHLARSRCALNAGAICEAVREDE